MLERMQDQCDQVTMHDKGALHTLLAPRSPSKYLQNKTEFNETKLISMQSFLSDITKICQVKVINYCILIN